MVFTPICSLCSHLSSKRPAIKLLRSADAADGSVEKLGQPEVPLRDIKFRDMTTDEISCPEYERAVIERKSVNPLETRQQTKKLSYPGETGSTGSRKPEVPVLVQKFDIFNFVDTGQTQGSCIAGEIADHGLLPY